MNTNSFFPLAEVGQIIVWLSHYALKLPIHDPVCGISAEEIACTLTGITCYIWLMQHWHPAVQRDAKESISFKRHIIAGSGDSIPYSQPSVFPNPPPMAAPGIKKRLFNQIACIKANSSYTEVIGHDLGIIASANTVEHLIPESTVTVELGATGNRVRSDFKKYGHDGIWIKSRINGGDWAFFAIDTKNLITMKAP